MQVFHFRVDRENRSQHMFTQDVITTIFSNVKSIYLFHAEHVLPQVSLLSSTYVCVPSQCFIHYKHDSQNKSLEMFSGII